MGIARLLLVALLTVATACNRGGEGAASTTTVPTTAPVSTTTTSPSYEVPEVIDAAYVERVMEALDHVDGEAGRRVVATRRFDEGFLQLLMAVYTPKTFNLVQEGWFEVAESDFEMIRPVPGDPET